MKPVLMPRVKICCIATVDEARLAIESGASAIGLVSEMPSGPGPIPEDLITEIAATVPPPIGSFLLTCKQDVASIIEQQRRLRTNTIQICDRHESGAQEDVQKAVPGISLLEVLHVTRQKCCDESFNIAPCVRAL